MLNADGNTALCPPAGVPSQHHCAPSCYYIITLTRDSSMPNADVSSYFHQSMAHGTTTRITPPSLPPYQLLAGCRAVSVWTSYAFDAVLTLGTPPLFITVSSPSHHCTIPLAYAISATADPYNGVCDCSDGKVIVSLSRS